MTDLFELRYAINLLPDCSVVTKEGEYLGPWDTDETDAFYLFTKEGEYLGPWDTDETDAFYLFTPDGASEPLFVDPHRWSLCDKIERWHAERQPAGE